MIDFKTLTLNRQDSTNYNDRQWQKQVITTKGEELLAQMLDSQLKLEITNVYIGYYRELENLQIDEFPHFLRGVTTLPPTNKVTTIINNESTGNKTVITIQIDNVDMVQSLRYNTIIVMVKDKQNNKTPFALYAIKTPEELLDQSQPIQIQLELITTVLSTTNVHLTVNPDLNAKRVTFKDNVIKSKTLQGAIPEVNNKFAPHINKKFTDENGIHGLKYDKISKTFNYYDNNRWIAIDLITDKVQELRDTLNQHKTKREQLNTKVDEEKRNLEDLSTKVTEKQNELNALTQTVNSEKQNLSNLTQTVNDEKPKIIAVSNDLDAQKPKISQNTIKITEHESLKIDTSVGVHGVRYQNEKLQVQINNDWIQAFDNGFPPKNVENIEIRVINDQTLNIKWTDPTDLEIDGAIISRWRGTKVVYKTGDYPTTPEDGTLAINSTTRNQYQSNGLRIGNLTNDTAYYISFFPYTTENVYNYNTANRGIGTTAATPDPVTRVKVEPFGSGALDIQYLDPEDRPNHTWQKTRVVFKEGSAPTNNTDGRYFDSLTKNQYGNGIGGTVSRLTNNTTYYFRFFVYTREGGVNDDVIVTATPKDIPNSLTMSIRKNDSNPATRCVYTGNLANIPVNDPKINTFIGHYPVLFKDGQEVVKIDPMNFLRTIDGDEINPAGSEGDIMIAFPRRTIKIKTISNDNPQITMLGGSSGEDFDCLAHKRGDVIKDKFYVGAYLASDVGGKLRSLPNKNPKRNLNVQTAIDMCQANGDGYDPLGYHQVNYLQTCYLLKYKNCDCQTAVGNGAVSGNFGLRTGGTETNGMDWGTQTNTDHVKCLGIEDLWGGFFQIVVGIAILGDGQLVTTTDNFNSTGDGYTPTGTTITGTNSGFTKYVIGNTKTGFVMSDNTGSSTTYFSDIGKNVLTPQQTNFMLYGGFSYSVGQCGIFNMHIDYKASQSGPDVTTRLMYL